MFAGRSSTGARLILGIQLLALTSPSIASAQAAPAPPSGPAQAATADRADTIERNDGGFLRGTLVEVVPNDHARIRLATGEIVTIAWQDIARIDRAPADDRSRLTTVETPSATASPAESKSLVLVHIVGSATAQIEQDTTGFNRTWEPVCSAPCDKALSVAFRYRIVGDGIRTSAPFTLSAQPGQRDVLGVTEGSKGGFVLGIVGAAVGGTAALTGLSLVIAGEVSRSVAVSESPSDLTFDNSIVTAGWIVTAAGAAILVGGVALLLSNVRTIVAQGNGVPTSDETSSGSPDLKSLPGFRDARRDTALGYPPAVGIPLFAGRF